MAFIKINSILKKRGQNEVRIIPAAVNGARTVSYTHLTLPTSDLV